MHSMKIIINNIILNTGNLLRVYFKCFCNPLPPTKKKYEGLPWLVVEWLRLRAPNAGGPGLILGHGTRSHMLKLSSDAATKDPT